MSKKNVPVTTIFSMAADLLLSKGAREAIFGKYSDNTVRSAVDALNGEYTSPKDKAKKENKKKAKKKKKKNKKKHKIKLQGDLEK